MLHWLSNMCFVTHLLLNIHKNMLGRNHKPCGARCVIYILFGRLNTTSTRYQPPYDQSTTAITYKVFHVYLSYKMFYYKFQMNLYYLNSLHYKHQTYLNMLDQVLKLKSWGSPEYNKFDWCNNRNMYHHHHRSLGRPADTTVIEYHSHYTEHTHYCNFALAGLLSLALCIQPIKATAKIKLYFLYCVIAPPILCFYSNLTRLTGRQQQASLKTLYPLRYFNQKGAC